MSEGMRLLLPASLASVFLLVVACGGTDTPADTTPAASGDDDSGTSGSHDASTSDGSSSATDGGAGSDSGDAASTADGGGAPTLDGGDDIACSGVASCAVGDACIADYATAQVASNWCRFDGVAKRVTEYASVCSGYHVVEISTGVVGALTLDYYDLNSGALVAIVHQSLNTQKNCAGSPPEVSTSPCGDSEGITTVLAEACTD
jgi:hypothetical protein